MRDVSRSDVVGEHESDLHLAVDRIDHGGDSSCPTVTLYDKDGKTIFGVADRIIGNLRRPFPGGRSEFEMREQMRLAAKFFSERGKGRTQLHALLDAYELGKPQTKSQVY